MNGVVQSIKSTQIGNIIKISSSSSSSSSSSYYYYYYAHLLVLLNFPLFPIHYGFKRDLLRLRDFSYLTALFPGST